MQLFQVTVLVALACGMAEAAAIPKPQPLPQVIEGSAEGTWANRVTHYPGEPSKRDVERPTPIHRMTFKNIDFNSAKYQSPFAGFLFSEQYITDDQFLSVVSQINSGKNVLNVNLNDFIDGKKNVVIDGSTVTKDTKVENSSPLAHQKRDMNLGGVDLINELYKRDVERPTPIHRMTFNNIDFNSGKYQSPFAGFLFSEQYITDDQFLSVVKQINSGKNVLNVNFNDFIEGKKNVVIDGNTITKDTKVENSSPLAHQKRDVERPTPIHHMTFKNIDFNSAKYQSPFAGFLFSEQYITDDQFLSVVKQINSGKNVLNVNLNDFIDGKKNVVIDGNTVTKDTKVANSSPLALQKRDMNLGGVDLTNKAYQLGFAGTLFQQGIVDNDQLNELNGKINSGDNVLAVNFNDFMNGKSSINLDGKTISGSSKASEDSSEESEVSNTKSVADTSLAPEFAAPTPAQRAVATSSDDSKAETTTTAPTSISTNEVNPQQGDSIVDTNWFGESRTFVSYVSGSSVGANQVETTTASTAEPSATASENSSSNDANQGTSDNNSGSSSDSNSQGDADTQQVQSGNKALTPSSTTSSSGTTTDSIEAGKTTWASKSEKIEVQGHNDDLEPWQQAILDDINYKRALHNSKPLTWNKKLAQFGADHLETTCEMKHSEMGVDLGDGLYVGGEIMIQSDSPDQAVDGWYAEKGHFNYDADSNGEESLHFRIMVGNDFTEIGCARKSGCSQWGMYICDFNLRSDNLTDREAIARGSDP